MAMAPAPATDMAEVLQRTAWCAVGAGLYVLYGTASNALLNARYRSQVTAELLLAMAALLRTHAHRIRQTAQLTSAPAEETADGEVLRQHAVLADQLQSARDLLLEAPYKPRRQLLASMLVVMLEMRDRMIASELDSTRVGLCSGPTLILFANMWQRMAEDVERIADALLTGRRPPAAHDHEAQLAALRQQPLQPQTDARCDPVTERALVRSMSVRLGDLNLAVQRLAALARGEVRWRHKRQLS